MGGIFKIFVFIVFSFILFQMNRKWYILNITTNVILHLVTHSHTELGEH